jgi:hypothetical protein
MELPRKVKVGKKWYTFHYVNKPKARLLGRCCYALGSIEVNTAEPAAEVRDTFWHELTHAILHDMDHPLQNDEKFVTGFSNRLTKAIDSAKF